MLCKAHELHKGVSHLVFSSGAPSMGGHLSFTRWAAGQKDAPIAKGDDKLFPMSRRVKTRGTGSLTYQRAGECDTGPLAGDAQSLVDGIQDAQRQCLVPVIIPHRVLLQVLQSSHGQWARSLGFPCIAQSDVWQKPTKGCTPCSPSVTGSLRLLTSLRNP